MDLAAEFWAGNDMPPFGDVDEPLDLDAASSRRIGDWYAVEVAYSFLGAGLERLTA